MATNLLMTEIHRKAIRRLSRQLEKTISLTGLISELNAEEIITDMDQKHIETEKIKDNGVKELLKIISQKPDTAFDGLCSALVKEEQGHLATLLTEKVKELEEIEESKNHGSRKRKPEESATSSDAPLPGKHSSKSHSKPKKRRRHKQVSSDDTDSSKPKADEELHVESKSPLHGVLVKQRIALVDSLQIDDGLMDHLLQYGVVDVRTKARLTGTGTREQKAEGLLDYLCSRSQKYVQNFVKALKNTRQTDLANLFAEVQGTCTTVS